MDRNIALEFSRVTEAGAIAASRWMGRGDEKAADRAAVRIMRTALNSMDIDGRIVIGEGERDEAPMLFVGEKVGKSKSKVKVDIAVDPLEGTTITAHGGPNALAVMAAAPRGTLLHAPDVYMYKVATGVQAKHAIDIRKSPTHNVKAVAKALNKEIRDVTVLILDRERHRSLIKEVRTTGARIRLIRDGDVAGAIATAVPDSGIDLLMGSGGSPEGVIASVALKCLGGNIQGKLLFRNNTEKARAKKAGIKNLNKIYKINDLAAGNKGVFAATGVTNGEVLKGVRFTSQGAVTNSLVMRVETGTVRFIEAHHVFKQKPSYYSKHH